ncbi:MAG: hypothetical protein WKF47_13175 [Geodermatophilaceae bacterium]
MSVEPAPSAVDAPSAAATGTGAPPGSARRRLPLTGLIALAVLILLAAVPLFVAPFQTSMLARMLIFALLAVSLDLLVGVTGLPSLGHAAYFGVGAYTAGLVAKYWTAAAPDSAAGRGRALPRSPPRPPAGWRSDRTACSS